MDEVPGGVAVTEFKNWNDLVLSLSNPHVLQSEQWAEVKEDFGWTSIKKIWRAGDGSAQAAASVLTRQSRIGGIGPGIKILYCPRGPILEWNSSSAREHTLLGLEELCRKEKGIFIKIDPEIILAKGIPGSADEKKYEIAEITADLLLQRGWKESKSQIQFANTVFLNLDGCEEEILARMKQKTRYNIRLAEKKGVRLRIADVKEFPRLYQIYAETSVRDNFVIRPLEYYLSVWRIFVDAGYAFPLVAEDETGILAGLILFVFGKRAWYLYGMSTQIHREKMPNYLLQWEAIKFAREAGCTIYDLWGAPDHFDETDTMQGVFRFKEGLGGEVIRTIGAWDYVARPNLYFLYTRIIPRILDIMRKRGKEKTKQELPG